MNIMKMSIFGLMLGVYSIGVQAEDKQAVVTLPTLTVMAEPEMSNETGYVPFVQEEKNLRALQHQVIRGTRDAENFMVNPDVVANLEIQPIKAPDLDSLSPALQQYVLTIAQGLQSSDPTQGLYTILENFGIDRSNSLQPDRNMKIQINLDKVNIDLLENHLNVPAVIQLPKQP